MRGEVSDDVVLVGVPAKEVWSAYRGVELGRLIDQLLGDVLGRVEVVEGDGCVGTILKVTFPPGTSGIGYMKEMFVKMDDEVRVKETEVIEGGYKALGFDLCRFRFEIIENDGESTTIRNTIAYEIDDSKAELASLISTKQLTMMAQTIGDYIRKQKLNH